MQMRVKLQKGYKVKRDGSCKSSFKAALVELGED